MGYAVHFKNVPPDLPAELQARVRLALDEVGEACTTIARDNDFWTYIKESGFVLEHRGWRFHYHLDRSARELVVDRCERIEDAPAGSA
jgi:hypothetical protein